KGDREQRAHGVGTTRFRAESHIVGQRGMGGAPNHRGADWLSCTGISPPAPDGVNTISCLVERFCNRSDHVMRVFCGWAWVFRAVHHLLDRGKTPLRNRHAAWLRFLSSP